MQISLLNFHAPLYGSRAVLAVCLTVLMTGCTGILGGNPVSAPPNTDAGVVLPLTTACGVQTFINSRCTACHSDPPTSASPMPLTTLANLRSLSPEYVTSTYAERAITRMQQGTMPLAPVAPANADEIALLTSWVSDGMPECDDGSDAGGPNLSAAVLPNLLPQNELFQCKGQVSDAPLRIRRINRLEWTRDVGGSLTRSFTGFSYNDNPFDPSSQERYSTWSTDESVDDATVDLLMPTVSYVGLSWTGPYPTGGRRLDRLRTDGSLHCMFADRAPTAACIHNFISVMLLDGVFFRPGSESEIADLTEFTNTLLASEAPWDAGSAGRVHTITQLSNAAWLMPQALFRTEMGATSNGSGRVELTDWELAQEVSYAIGTRAPGATEHFFDDIAGAAADGGIHNPATIDALLRSNYGGDVGMDGGRDDLAQDWDPRRTSRRSQYWVAAGVAQFFREWLGYYTVPSVFKDRPEATSQYDDGSNNPYREQATSWGNLMSGYFGYDPTLIMQMDDFVSRVVYEDTDVLKNLLTTRKFYLAASQGTFTSVATGEPYGTRQERADDRQSRWVTLPDNERAGVLTHPAWLGSYGNNVEDDPSAVHRGKWIRENLLCGYVPPLSQVKVMAKVGPHAADKSARARLLEATSDQQCQVCHHLMNPLGLPFEIYNHAGYLRAKDHSPADGGWGPPDGTSTLVNMPDPALNGPVRDGVELSEKLADSAYVKRCFVRQAFRYFMGRPENLSDACMLTQMEQAYDTHGGSFKSMISTLLTSDSYRTRRVPGAAE